MDKAHQYRQLCASVIASDPEKYTTGYLGGKTNSEYTAYILDPQKWGSGIELEILSDNLQVQIACVDVESKNLLIYGEAKNYSRRVYLAYSGIHYDVLAEVKGNHQVTSFSPNDAEMKALVMTWVTNANARGQFVNPAKFTIKCEVALTPSSISCASVAADANYSRYLLLFLSFFLSSFFLSLSLSHLPAHKWINYLDIIFI